MLFHNKHNLINPKQVPLPMVTKILMPNTNFFIVIADIIIFVLMIKYLPLDPEPAKGLALLIFIGILWLTEALHLTVTALLVPVLAVVLGILPTPTAFVSFANTTVFLFFGGYAIAAAFHTQDLDRMIATKMIRMAKGNFALSTFYLFAATVLLSMWVNNTAVAAMMLPLAVGLLSSIELERHRQVYAFVLLGIAYSSTIGGLGTAVGSMPNAILVSQMNITFADMFSYGFPLMIALLPFMFISLFVVFRPNLNIKFNGIEEDIPMNRQRLLTLVLFLIVAFMWIFSKYINPFLSSLIGLEGNIAAFDSVIAVIAAILVITCKVTTWKDVSEHTNWGLLFIFGGGITLTLVLSNTGAGKVLADSVVSMIEGRHYFIIGLIIAFFVIFFTEVASNVAVATLLIPLFISIAEAMGSPPLGLALIIAFGTSCAFMLPVATAPNAIVYGTGHIKQSDMVKAGFILNIFSSFLIGSSAYLFWL